MYPGTIFELQDKSDIPQIPEVQAKLPLFMTAISSDKGPENLRVVKKDQFYKLYGTDISFAKHGQPLLQAGRVVDNGGALLVKRIVAPDSKLANIAVVAKVTQADVQKKDTTGNLLYTDAVTGLETIVAAGNEAIMLKVASIKYECKSVTDASTMTTIATLIEADLNEEGVAGVFTYPLWAIADIGRGVSNKRFRITPNYEDSKNVDYMRYKLETIEKNQILETVPFVFNPDIAEGGLNRSIQSVINKYSLQLTAKVFEASVTAMIAKVAELSGETVDTCREMDLLFAKNKKGLAVSNIVLDPTGFNLSYLYGIDLENGTNGVFGDAPFGTEAYEDQLVEFFNGIYTSDIYDVDNYKIDAIVDCNYTPAVKRAIEDFVTFREDAHYFRDLGLGLVTLNDILDADKLSLKNAYCSTYHNSYDVIDPYTKKQISVTIGYNIAKLLLEHFKAGRHRPFAGQLYGVTIDEAIEGTVNFVPKITPSQNQKQILDDARINYASYYDGLLTVETLYTSQEKFTQLSFSNNILAIQEVAKAVRTECPKMRYSFIEGKDLDKYKRDVQVVLDRFTANFVELKMVYIEDTTMVANKVYFASIQFKFKNFVQTEYFKLFALS